MKTRSILFILISMVLLIQGCVKETYNMKMLSKKAHLSPSLAISAVKGDIAFSDAVKPNDTVTFDQNKLVTIIFKKDLIVDLTPTDFTKGTISKTAVIKPGSIDLNIKDFLSHISGDFLFSNPSLKFIYTNSFPDSVKINFSASGKRADKVINLMLKPFGLAKPNIPTQQEVSSLYMIDKNNSNLPAVLSLPPEVINYSGTVTLSTQVKSDQDYNNALIPPHLTGSVEIQIPMDLKINNLQFTDTLDNFIQSDNNSDSQLKIEDFQTLSVIVTASNGFPLGVSLKMSLYDPQTQTILSTVDASGILDPAPVDGTGKVTGDTESSVVIDFSKEFLSKANNADKLIFRFTLNSSGNGTKDVKIYSDYRINFTAALVAKPDINLK